MWHAHIVGTEIGMKAQDTFILKVTCAGLYLTTVSNAGIAHATPTCSAAKSVERVSGEKRPTQRQRGSTPASRALVQQLSEHEGDSRAARDGIVRASWFGRHARAQHREQRAARDQLHARALLCAHGGARRSDAHCGVPPAGRDHR